MRKLIPLIFLVVPCFLACMKSSSSSDKTSSTKNNISLDSNGIAISDSVALEIQKAEAELKSFLEHK